MSLSPYIITGNIHTDARGRLLFFNDFDMTAVKRFYQIANNGKQSTKNKTVRAWQGHKIEQKYFFVTRGAFFIGLVKIDDWWNPSDDLPVEPYRINADARQILHVPAGYASGIKPLQPGSQMIVFSTLSLDESKKDDYRFEPGLWLNWDIV